jgi:hypothetical protein
MVYYTKRFHDVNVVRTIEGHAITVSASRARLVVTIVNVLAAEWTAPAATGQGEHVLRR